MQIDKDLKATFAIIALLLAGFGFGVYLPSRLEQGQLEERIAKADQALKANEKTAHGLNDLRVAVADMRTTLEHSSKLIPKTNDLASFLRVIDAELDQQKMIEAEKLTEKIVLGRDYNMIPLTLRFRGDYDGVYQFVKKLEGIERLIRVNRLQVKGSPNQPDEPVEVRVELATFAASVEAN